MKKIKSLQLMVVIGLGFFLTYITTVFAAGSANLSIEGNSTVAEGSNITLTIAVNNITSDAGGVVSVGGTIKFNPTYLQYVSSDASMAPYQTQYQAANAASGSIKIAALDNSMESGITSSARMISVTFKALKKGSTTVTFENGEITDTADILNATFGSKTITIGESTPVEPVEEKSKDATLSGLAVDGYTISPAFDKDTTNYTLTVPNDATSINVTGLSTDKKASVSGTGTKTLKEGSNEIAIVVTAEDGTTKKTYILTITREEKKEEPVVEKSKDATLKKLDVSGFTLYPTFNKDVTNYNMSVNNNITALNVEALATDSKAKVDITGTSGWVVGVNAIKIKVTAEDGTEKIYTVNVTRKAGETTPASTTPKSSNNYLKELSTTTGELSPKFSSTTNNYNITVPYEVNKLDLKAVATDGKAKVNIKGNENFKVGEVNVVEIEVIAEDGSSRSYTINVTKSAKTSNNKLDDLIVSGGSTAMTPKFSPDTYEYDVEVAKGTKTLDIKPIINNSKAKVEVTGNDELKEGNNVILVKVTDENGFVQYYKINAYKKVSSGSTIFGSEFPWWILLIILFLIPIIILLWLLTRRDKDEKETSPVAPTIEFKPEFNFSSKNGTDDDYVEAGGVLNQVSDKKDLKDLPNSSFNSDMYGAGTSTNQLNEPKVIEAKVEEIPYDPYDEVVTKDELIDAINEKDVAKLKILYEQEMLNREKERVKEQEESSKMSREERNKDEEI